MYKVSLDTIEIENCHVVTPTGKAIRCYTLLKDDLGATIAKKQLLFCLKTHKPCRRLFFLSHTPRTKLTLFGPGGGGGGGRFDSQQIKTVVT